MSAESKAKKKKLYRERMRANKLAHQGSDQTDEAAASASMSVRSCEEKSSAFMGQASSCGKNVPGLLEVGLSKQENRL